MEEKETNFGIYRSSTVGSKLKETLDEMLRTREITKEISDQVFSRLTQGLMSIYRAV